MKRLVKQGLVLGAFLLMTACSGDSDFNGFWRDFQKAVAANDTAALMEMSNDQTKSFLSTGSASFFNEEFKKDIAKTRASQVEEKSAGHRKYIYKQMHGVTDPGGYEMYSTFGFEFRKIDEKWLITAPIMGG